MVLSSIIVNTLKLHNTITIMRYRYIVDNIDQIDNSFIKIKIDTTKLYRCLSQGGAGGPGQLMRTGKVSH